ncbi:NADPH oxidase 4-like [Pectinophora gossypiella]|uniref:NADPH oxidase 4-like n=1 Tax=Pectinophora gossypiella TaxID=13191 RepID=UPI00214F4FD8|nr:NADPH oxidase 4-like [Pectinophora gossypiella]
MGLRIIKHGYDFLKSRFFLISWISLVTYIFYHCFVYYKNERQYYYLRRILGVGLCVSRGSATVLNICCALVLLPLCKKLNQILYRILCRAWPGLFFFWLERTKSFHMTVAITLYLFAVIHSISHFSNFWNFSRNYDEVRPDINLASYKNENPLLLLLSQPGLTGLAMLAITTTMCIMSLRVVRRKLYNAFWYTHQLYLPFMVLLIIHPLSGVLKENVLEENEPIYYSTAIDEGNNSSYVTRGPIFVPIKSKTWMWMVFPLSCFFLDLIWRIFARNRTAVDIINVTAMPGRIINLRMSCPHEEFDCRPGQYVLLQCPDISSLEWHPFTVVKVPNPEERNFVVWIKVRGDWTETLENLVNEKEFSKLKMLVDGPMCSPMERAAGSGVALCVAAGVGITPFVPLLEHLLREPRSELPGRVHLLWVVRSEREVTPLAELATKCLRTLRDSNRPDRLHLQIHVTNSRAGNAPANTIVNEKGVTYVLNIKEDDKNTLLTPNVKKKMAVNREMDDDKFSLAREYPLLGCRLNRGRPYWDQVVGYWVHLYPRQHLSLYCCGPKKLVRILRNKCKDVSNCTKTKITFVHERFS